MLTCLLPFKSIRNGLMDGRTTVNYRHSFAVKKERQYTAGRIKVTVSKVFKIGSQNEATEPLSSSHLVSLAFSIAPDI